MPDSEISLAERSLRTCVCLSPELQIFLVEYTYSSSTDESSQTSAEEQQILSASYSVKPDPFMCQLRYAVRKEDDVAYSTLSSQLLVDNRIDAVNMVNGFWTPLLLLVEPVTSDITYEERMSSATGNTRAEAMLNLWNKIRGKRWWCSGHDGEDIFCTFASDEDELKMRSAINKITDDDISKVKIQKTTVNAVVR